MKSNRSESTSRGRRGDGAALVVAASALLATIAGTVISCGDADLFIAGTPPLPTIAPPDETPEATETPEF